MQGVKEGRTIHGWQKSVNLVCVVSVMQRERAQRRTGRALAGGQQNGSASAAVLARPRCVVSLTAHVTVPADGRQQPSTLVWWEDRKTYPQ